MGGVDEFDIEAHAVSNSGCPYCGALTGDGCLTKSSRPTRAHSGRVWPFQQAWGDGYQYGWDSAVGFAADAPERWAKMVESRRAR